MRFEGGTTAGDRELLEVHLHFKEEEDFGCIEKNYDNFQSSLLTTDFTSDMDEFEDLQ